MMRKEYRFMLIAVLLAVLTLGFVLYKEYKISQQSEALYVAPVLAQQHADVNRIVIAGAASPVELERDKKNMWRVMSSGGYPARQDKVQTLLDTLAAAQKNIPPATNVAEEYVNYGVAENSARASFFVDQTRLATIHIGNIGTAEGVKTYLRNSEALQVWESQRELALTTCNGTWIQQGLVHFNPENVKVMVLQRHDGKSVRLYKNNKEDTSFTLDSNESEDALALPLNVTSLMHALNRQTVLHTKAVGHVSFPTNQQTEMIVTTFQDNVFLLTMAEVDGAVWARYDITLADEIPEGFVRDIEMPEDIEQWAYRFADSPITLLVKE